MVQPPGLSGGEPGRWQARPGPVSVPFFLCANAAREMFARNPRVWRPYSRIRMPGIRVSLTFPFGLPTRTNGTPRAHCYPAVRTSITGRFVLCCFRRFLPKTKRVPNGILRCIRHRNDFGAIVLCDPRYASQSETTACLSKWVRSSVRQCRTVEASLPQVEAFFRRHQPQLELNGGHSKPAVERPIGRPATGPTVSGDSSCGQANESGRQERRERREEQGADGIAKVSPGPGLVQQTLAQVWPPRVRTTCARCDCACG